jgi:hypothetical protein
VAVLVPSRLTVATLEATGLVVANLSSRIAPRPLEVRLVRSVDGSDPLVIVGMPAEQELLDDVTAESVAVERTEIEPKIVLRDRPSLDSPSGVVALGRSQDGPPILLLTGNSPEAVQRAGWALAGNVGMQGELAVVSELPEWQPTPPRHWRGFAPPRSRFSLTDLGHGAGTRLDADVPVRLAVRFLPDTRFLPYGHRLNLSLRRLPALLDQSDGAVEIHWNDTAVRSFAAAEVPRKPQFALEVPLAAEVLRTENVLQLSWRGSAGTSGPVLELDSDGSEFYVPREHGAQLPDLALLRWSLFPFGLRPDLSDVVLVVPERLNEETFALVCELANFLGRSLPTDRIGLRVRQPSTLSDDERSSSHLILFRTSKGSDAFAEAFPDPAKLPEQAANASLPVLQAAISPWNQEKYLLSFQASSAAALLRAFRSFSDARVLAELKGDTAFLSSRGPVCHTLGPQRLVREARYLTRAEAYLRSHWLALPAVLAAISGLLYVALRLVLEQRRAAVRAGAELSGGAP